MSARVIAPEPPTACSCRRQSSLLRVVTLLLAQDDQHIGALRNTLGDGVNGHFRTETRESIEDRTASDDLSCRSADACLKHH